MTTGIPIRFLLSCWLTVATFGCASPTQTRKPEPQPVKVSLAIPQRGEIARTITLPVSVAAWQQVTLYAKVAGYLDQITVDRGDHVQEGALLAQIEVPELVADIAKAKAELEAAALLSSRMRDARGKAPDLVMPQSADDAAARLATAQATVARQQSLLGFARITAPFAGVVTDRFVDRGAFVPAATAGSTPAGAAILTIADFGRVRARVAVPEPDVPLVKPGQAVDLSFAELGSRAFHATVSRIAYRLDDATRTMLAEIDIENPDGDLRPGMYGSARIAVESHTNALLVPRPAVVTEKTGRSVFTVDAGNHARKKTVRTGFENADFVEIVGELGDAEAVIVVGKTILADGQRIERQDQK